MKKYILYLIYAEFSAEFYIFIFLYFYILVFIFIFFIFYFLFLKIFIIYIFKNKNSALNSALNSAYIRYLTIFFIDNYNFILFIKKNIK